MTTPFRRPLPSTPDLGQQRSLAKELLRAFHSGDGEAQARIRAELPDKQRIVLADAQHVLAREYGFQGWTALKQYIAGSTADAASLNASLREALEHGDAKTLRTLLDRHADLRARINDPIFPFDSPALVHFAGRNDLAMVDVLLAFGADPNRRSSWWAGGFHALHVARGEVADRLLEAGAVPDACAAAQLDRLDLLSAIIAADPARVHERGGDGQTPLHFARSKAAIDLLLEAGADPDAKDVDHHATPAQWMLDRRRGAGRYDLALHLVEHGAEADIFLAAALGLVDRVRELLAADPSQLDLRTTRGDYAEHPPASYHIYMWTIGADLSPTQVAAQFDQTAVLEVMLAAASPRQRLLTALARGDGAEARSLLIEQPDLLASLSDPDLHVLPQAGAAGNARAIGLMLDLGIDIDTRDSDGATVLHHAAWRGAADCVETVLRHPSAHWLLEIRDNQHHSTPLGWCCHGSCYSREPGRDHARVASLLLEAGARPGPNLQDASAQVRAVIEGRR